MSLFDQRPRHPDQGAMPDDPAYAYLNRSGRPERGARAWGRGGGGAKVGDFPQRSCLPLAVF